MLRRKDFFLIALVLVCAALLYGVNRLLPKPDIRGRTAQLEMPEEAIELIEPGEEQTGETGHPTAAFQALPAGPSLPGASQPVRGYVVLTLNGRQYGDPIPMDREKRITVRQTDQKVNTIRITPNSVVMESSTCENQNCVGQGEVTLENYKSRILDTYIICLPNGLQIEMVPVDADA